jgi:hypothetical protein
VLIANMVPEQIGWSPIQCALDARELKILEQRLPAI